MDLGWACDDHIEDLAVLVHKRGLDTVRHIFEVSRTCRVEGSQHVPCGGAGDYLVVRAGGEAVITLCGRHMREWAPPKERADWF
jgi:hypothetical protein